MQMAMVSTAQKPTQRERFGKFSEGLPGSTKSVACMERNAQELGRPDRFLHLAVHWGVIHHSEKQVGGAETPSREAEDRSGVGSARSTRRR